MIVDLEAVTAFVEARLEEDEALARDAGDGSAADYRWRQSDPGQQPGLIGTGLGGVVTFNRGTPTYAVSPSREQAAHIARHDPARVLRQAGAVRAVIALGDSYAMSLILRHFAAIWPDHPDYRREWAP